MKKILLGACMVLISNVALAGQCTGKIIEIQKWNTADTISIRIDGANRLIRMPSKSDEAMALSAFATGKTVIFNWVDGSASASCTDGWNDNRTFNGWWNVVN